MKGRISARDAPHQHLSFALMRFRMSCPDHIKLEAVIL